MSTIKIIVLIQVFALLVMMALTALHKFDMVPFKIAFGGFALCLLFLLLGTIVCLVSIIALSFYGHHETALSLKFLGVAVGTIPLVLIVFVVGLDGFSKPRIHDISTDPEKELRFDVLLSQRAVSHNSLDLPSKTVVNKQRQAYPLIKPIVIQYTTLEAYKKALEVAKALKWEIVTQSESELTFEAIDETPLFGFKDDIIVVVSPSKAGLSARQSVVNLRSVSRVGVSDLGANAKRIQRFAERLTAAAQ